jgi:hypothetical protein
MHAAFYDRRDPYTRLPLDAHDISAINNNDHVSQTEK